MKKNIFIIILISLFSIGTSLFLANIIYNLLNGNVNDFQQLISIHINTDILKYTSIFSVSLIIFFIVLLLLKDTKFSIKNVRLTDNISIPKRFKNSKQFGSAQFFNNKNLDKKFKSSYVYNDLTDIRNNDIKSAGIIINYKKYRRKEKIYYINDNVHTIVLGGSRVGKTRHFCFQLLAFLIMAGENFIANDIKQELINSCIDLLKFYNYNIIIFNFNNLSKSNHYNFLENIIKSVNDNDLEKAESEIWNMATILSSTDDSYQKGEQFWQDGQISLIATAIMCVVYNNKNNYSLQNMGNVYNFLATMCAVNSQTGDEPIIKYIDSLENTNPIKRTFAIVRLAPTKTRLSFYTSALASLRLFSSKMICSMTCKTDIDFSDLDSQKVSIFLVSSAEKDTYNKLLSLMISQIYTSLADKADTNGGQLKKRFNFVLDEFANIKVNNFSEILTVAGGRKIRFYLFLQSLSQLNSKYSKDYATTIIDNCKVLVYLNSLSTETLTEIQSRLGTYTTATNSTTSSSGVKNQNYSQSINLVSRNLLKIEELAKLQRPYVLIIFSGEDPILTKIPDLSKWNFNNFLGLGDIEHNNYIRDFRSSQIPILNTSSEFNFWDLSKSNINEEGQKNVKK